MDLRRAAVGLLPGDHRARRMRHHQVALRGGQFARECAEQRLGRFLAHAFGRESVGKTADLDEGERIGDQAPARHRHLAGERKQQAAELSSQAQELNAMVEDLLAMVGGASARQAGSVVASRTTAPRTAVKEWAPAAKAPAVRKAAPPPKPLAAKASAKTAKPEEVIPLDDEELSRF